MKEKGHTPEIISSKKNEKTCIMNYVFVNLIKNCNVFYI